MPAALALTSNGDRAPAPADPRTEYVSGGAWSWSSGVFTTLAAHASEAAGRHGDGLRDAMMLDPTVRSSVMTLVAQALADGLQALPSHSEDSDPDGELTPAERADIARSAEIADFCGRNLAAVGDRLDAGLVEQITWGLAYGCRLAELVYADAPPDGPDRGKLYLDDYCNKPQSAWAFALDSKGRWIGIAPNAPDAPPVLEKSKFAVFRVGPKDGDPRGTSALETAYTAWNFKVQVWPEYWKYLSRFGVPGLYGTTGESATAVPVKDANGVETGKYLSPQEAMRDGLLAYENASVAVGPFGSTLTVINPTGEGAAFRSAFDECRREVVFAITQQVRATLEAQHSSKSDSETSQDILGVVVRLLKRSIAALVREQVLRPLVELNFGPAVAARFTPVVQLGSTEAQDFSRNANAVAKLAAAGVLTEPMVPKLLGWLGLGSLGRLFKPGQKTLRPEPAPAAAPPPAREVKPAPAPSKAA